MPDEGEFKFKRGSVFIWPFLKVMLLLLPLVIALGVATFFYVQWQEAREQVEQIKSENQIEDANIDKEVERAVNALSESVLLPTGETPTISTITNKEELLENREFFESAENGDQVLVYHQAKKAFLYRPSTNKLINLAPINISGDVSGDKEIEVSDSDETGSTSSEETKEEIEAENGQVNKPVSVELRNGTESIGVTYKFETKLKRLLLNVEVEISDRNNASRQDYEMSVVVVGNLVHKSVGRQIASALGLSVVVLPSGEDKAQADI